MPLNSRLFFAALPHLAVKNSASYEALARDTSNLAGNCKTTTLSTDFFVAARKKLEVEPDTFTHPAALKAGLDVFQAVFLERG